MRIQPKTYQPQDNRTRMKKLAYILKELEVFQVQNVNLKNAGQSNFYVDVKKAYGTPEVLDRICQELWQIIPHDVTVVAGSGYGGIPLATALSLKYSKKLSLIRDSPRTHGTEKTIEGYIPKENDKVAIVDDVVTTGGGLRNSLKELNETEVAGCYVIVKRGIVADDLPVYYLLDAEQIK